MSIKAACVCVVIDHTDTTSRASSRLHHYHRDVKLQQGSAGCLWSIILKCNIVV